MSKEDSLRAREKKKRKKPNFVSQESWKHIRLGRNAKWKRPRGHSSKTRKELKGRLPVVKVGYRGPKDVRDYHPCGAPEALVHAPKDLEDIDEDVVVRIGSIGTKKKIEVLKKALEKGLKVLNPKIKFVKVSNVEDMEDNLEIRDYIERFIISKKLIDEEREEVLEKAEELEIDLQE